MQALAASLLHSIQSFGGWAQPASDPKNPHSFLGLGEPNFLASRRSTTTLAYGVGAAVYDEKQSYSHTTSSSMMGSKSLWDGNYEIDSITGFVPSSPPVTKLPNAFALWEKALSTAPNVLALGDDESPLALEKRDAGRHWRELLDNAPVLDTSTLENEQGLLRRAHHVLAFLVHFYVHSRPPSSSSSTSTSSSILIPKSLAVPLVSVSRKLRIAPVLTFADTVLWNHEIIDPTRPLDRTNIRPLTLFTSGSDEANFYGCCAEIELRGVEALRAIARFYDMTTLQSETDLSLSSADEIALDHAASCLKTVARVIRDLTVILQSVRQICDPHAFYFAVRPWFRGSDAAGPAATPSSQRWIYQGVDEKDILELSGPSAGQSSIIHTFDIFLDVDHSNNLPHSPPNSDSSAADLAPSICPHAKNLPPSENGIPSSSPSPPSCPKQANQSQQLPNGEFMNRMRLYMPGSHQAFLEQLTKYTHEQAGRRSIRQLAAQYPHKLLQPYNEAVLALKQFRDAHIRIACLYVVSMSRKGNVVPAGAEQGMPSMCPAMRQRQSEPVRGTGGNELSLLLKSCRDATSRTLLTHQ